MYRFGHRVWTSSYIGLHLLSKVLKKSIENNSNNVCLGMAGNYLLGYLKVKSKASIEKMHRKINCHKMMIMCVRHAQVCRTFLVNMQRAFCPSGLQPFHSWKKNGGGGGRTRWPSPYGTSLRQCSSQIIIKSTSSVKKRHKLSVSLLCVLEGFQTSCFFSLLPHILYISQGVHVPGISTMLQSIKK